MPNDYHRSDKERSGDYHKQLKTSGRDNSLYDSQDRSRFSDYNSEDQSVRTDDQVVNEPDEWTYSQTSTEMVNTRTRSFYDFEETSDNTTQLSSWAQVADSDVDSLGVYNTKRYYTDSNTVSITATENSFHSEYSTSFKTGIFYFVGNR